MGAVMPMDESAIEAFQGQEGDFPGAENVKGRVEAIVAALDADGDNKLTKEELGALLKNNEAEALAGKSSDELVEIMSGCLCKADNWSEEGPKLMAIEQFLAN